MKILIIQQRYGIGDLIIFLPYIHAISKKFKTKVSLLVKESSKASDLLSNDKNIDEILILDKDKDGIKGFFKLSNEIKKRKFDKVFIFNSSLRYNLIAKFSGVKSVFQYPLFRSKDNLVLSAKIFTENVTGEIVSTEPNLDIKSIDEFDKNIKHIVLGISASGLTKRWDIQNYIRLAQELKKKHKCKFYLAGGINDIDLIRKFKDSGVDDKCESFERLTIKETLPIIKNCDLVVSNDTGFAHIACALKVKTLTLFMDSPVMTYGKYSSFMEVIEPVGEKNTTVHDTLGSDRISFDEVLAKSNSMLN